MNVKSNNNNHTLYHSFTVMSRLQMPCLFLNDRLHLPSDPLTLPVPPARAIVFLTRAPAALCVCVLPSDVAVVIGTCMANLPLTSLTKYTKIDKGMGGNEIILIHHTCSLFGINLRVVYS